MTLKHFSERPTSVGCKHLGKFSVQALKPLYTITVVDICSFTMACVLISFHCCTLPFSTEVSCPDRVTAHFAQQNPCFTILVFMFKIWKRDSTGTSKIDSPDAELCCRRRCKRQEIGDVVPCGTDLESSKIPSLARRGKTISPCNRKHLDAHGSLCVVISIDVSDLETQCCSGGPCGQVHSQGSNFRAVPFQQVSEHVAGVQ